MPDTKPTRRETARQLTPLLFLGVILVGSNRSFTFIDDEVWILDGAAQPLRTTLALFRSGIGQHEHPPLYDILLHFWLRATGGNFQYLRVPAILFFLAGLFLLARVAYRLGGPVSGMAVCWLGALWPFAFHYGRLAAWYSFAFFLVAGLTLAYLRYIEKESLGRWIALLVAGTALLWTNYFGWALIGCLVIDQFLRYRAGEKVIRPAILAGTVALYVLTYIPLFPAFRHEIATGINFHHRAVAVIANAAFNVYSLFVSESVAPWYWRFSVPAGIAVLVCIFLVFWFGSRSSRRFLIYSAFLIAVMAVVGILDTKRLLLVAPWVLLPIAVALGAGAVTGTGAETWSAITMPRWSRIALGLALVTFAGIGWFGIYSRHYYSALRFTEPWPVLAGDAANKVANNATVISNNPSFFFYLTYALRVPYTGPKWAFKGILPDDVQDTHVMYPDQWLAAGHPISPTMIWVLGAGDPSTQGPMDDAAHQLGQSCGPQMSRLMMRDAGYAWKQRYLPEPNRPLWRIEIHEYDCQSTNSKEILPIPIPLQ